MSQKEIQNESHDWLADAAESLVRYYFAKRGYCVYGAGKWAGDAVIQDKKTGKMLTVEVKSTDSESSDKKIHARLNKILKEKLEKIEVKARPDIYAEVRLKRITTDADRFSESNDISIAIWGIDKKEMTIVDSAKVLKTARDKSNRL